MSDLTGKFTVLQEQMDTQHTQTQEDLNAIRASIGEMESWLYSIQFAVEGGNRSLLAAIAQNSPCTDCAELGVIVPPIDTEINPIDDDKCKRAQAMLECLSSVYTVMDSLSAFSVSLNFTLVSQALTEVWTQLGNTDPLPLPSFPEASGIINDSINYVLSNALVGATLVEYFYPLKLALRDVIYAAPSPSAAKSSFDGYIDSTGIPEAAKALLKSSAYIGLWNYYLDPASDPNLTGFSGDVCGVPSGSCYTLTSVPFGQIGGGSAHGTNVPFGAFIPVDTVNSSTGEISFTEPVFYGGDLDGWTWEVLTGEFVYIQYRLEGLDGDELFSFTTSKNPDGLTYDCPAPTGTFHFESLLPFTIRLCYTPEV